MKDRIYIIGVCMTPIVKQDGGSYEHLCGVAPSEAMTDAGLCMENGHDAIEAGWYGNCAQGLLTRQHSIRDR